MATSEDSVALTEERRREIFLALVECQDRRMTVPQSREEVSRRFEITTKEVEKIEREGLDKGWPPL
jgi:hypothetical protein